jgi:hypothetical protein
MLYMKTLIIILLSITSTIVAQLPSKLDDLKAKKEAAIKRIEDTYKVELEKLLNDPMVKADQQLQMAIRDELGLIVVSEVEFTTNKELERLFVNKSWYSIAKVEYHFEKDGTGTRAKIPLSWRILSNGLVEVSSRMAVNGPIKMWYFKFNSKQEAFFGSTENNTVDPLTPDK